jgi:hypothetical protein
MRHSSGNPTLMVEKSNRGGSGNWIGAMRHRRTFSSSGKAFAASSQVAQTGQQSGNGNILIQCFPVQTVLSDAHPIRFDDFHQFAEGASITAITIDPATIAPATEYSLGAPSFAHFAKGGNNELNQSFRVPRSVPHLFPRFL